MRLPGLYYPLLLLQSHPVRHICRVEALVLAESGRGLCTAPSCRNTDSL